MKAPDITPGPWRQENHAANGEMEIGISRDWEHGGHSVCSVDSSRDSRRLNADAKAIAAVPEVLAALAGLVQDGGWKRSELDPEISAHRPRIAALDALEKAGFDLNP